MEASEGYSGIVALVISGLSLLVSCLSWYAAHQSAEATIFEKRFEVYRDAEQFVSAWVSGGKPDMNKLRLLVDAWNRSHFLFSPKVTTYIREVWLDAIEAAEAYDSVEQGYAQDRAKAIELKYALLKKYAEESGPLRKAFEGEMSVRHGWPL